MGTDWEHDDEQRRHNRRYIIFAIVMALVVLAFSAISITVVISTSGR
jgi:hypothetical protein